MSIPEFYIRMILICHREKFVTVVKSLVSFNNFWSPTRDKFTVTTLSLALFETQAFCKTVTESSEFCDSLR